MEKGESENLFKEINNISHSENDFSVNDFSENEYEGLLKRVDDFSPVFTKEANKFQKKIEMIKSQSDSSKTHHSSLLSNCRISIILLWGILFVLSLLFFYTILRVLLRLNSMNHPF
ncbi:hypothetical protein ENUP19_0111G0005 [Entamoeba nuttalli]|uniref:Uncharacterized protein n=2 Tax=Entamoeba nuttalli TaxID=412467 RepID=K2GXR8_ENTNP|nr:hypothetical protein ENU1_103510 [Entamoeba nuttalli P19]EKE40063.1 hypothetical protein ENU1_103510 [Entamoeba nuttalli P19]|eukprot:XP_008857603.1 hypothetical protein ENU1_103510 [Entamoeba nuttalli P19]